MTRHLPFLLLPALLTACTVGPNYAGPPDAAPHASKAGRFARADESVTTTAQPGVAHWWEELGDPTLNTLEQRALAANPDLAGAEARLRQARASLREQKANLLPKADATALYAHARFPGLNLDNSDSGSDSGSGGSSAIDLYNLGFDASWEVDLFGGQRNPHRPTSPTRRSA